MNHKVLSRLRTGAAKTLEIVGVILLLIIGLIVAMFMVTLITGNI